jgi:hypothetical protein
MRVLICGDRNWTNAQLIDEWIATLPADTIIIQGEARGADSTARDSAKERGLVVESYPADWEQYGRAAGPVRNKQMLDAKPDYVLAFHHDIANSKGTANMVALAEKAGIPVRLIG